MLFKWLITVLIVLHFQSVLTDHCIKKYFNHSSFVCACDRSSCPSIPATTRPPKGFIDQWISSQKEHRFNLTRLNIANLNNVSCSEPIEVTLNFTDQRQAINGFGGGFSDATGINLLALPMELRDQILKDYFTSNGIDYSIGRVPIAGTDFSARYYSYDDTDEDDLDLKYFSLQPEDTKLKIPMIKRALELRNDSLKLIGSSWSSPGWMKINGQIVGAAPLKGSAGGPYYKAWAKYYVKFLDSYAENGINFWAISTQNEPNIPIETGNYELNVLRFEPDDVRDWIKYDLGPELQKAGYRTDKLNLLLLDDNRAFLVNYTSIVLEDEEAASFVSGIAFHWYIMDGQLHYDQIDEVHEKFPNYFLISNEASQGYQSSSGNRVQLGNWTRAEDYAKDIIEDLNRYTTGWLDWNLVLDTNGSSENITSVSDGLILVDTNNTIYYRNPMFYAMGHFSKFIPPGSVYIGHQVKGDYQGVYLTAFQSPSNHTVLVILNTNDNPVDLVINNFTSISVPTHIDEHSIKTLITPSI